ncbi:MAG: hypothetical protein ABSD38_05830 [Syntrophorhabdales bacterium]|jgi:hypothetical protein
MKEEDQGNCRRAFPEDAPDPSYDTLRAPVDGISFLRYYEIAMKAASMAGPSPTPKERVMPGSVEDSGHVIEVVFGDTPLARMTIAIKDQMSREGQTGGFPAVYSRMLALIALIRKGSLKQWAISIPNNPHQLLYPEAIIFVAAVAPLDDLSFDLDQFERMVNRRIDPPPANPGHLIAFEV